VTEGDTQSIDRDILLALRSPTDPADPIGPRWLEEALRDVTALGGFTVLTLIVVVTTLAFLFHGKGRQAGVLAAVAILAQIASSTTKLAYARPRPDLMPHEAYVYSASYPSGHSLMAAAVFLTLATMIASLETRRRTKALVYGLAVILTVGVGFSRIYLGVHWPTDVLGGWTLGAAWALAGWIVLRWLAGRRVD